jgi:hypothetical protein
MLLLASPVPTVEATSVTCDSTGDAAGWAIAAGKDFDGDGIGDIAMGAPCASVQGEPKVGRVYIHSGATGRRLLAIRGTTADQKFGGAIDFIDDVSGDGLADLLVGSLSWDVIDMTTTKPDAGKFDIYSVDGSVVMSVEGAYGAGNFGEAIAAIRDTNGDDTPDLIVGAGGDREMVGGDRLGAAYLLSGNDGSLIDLSLGDLKSDLWGSVVSAIADLNDDGIDDVIVASNSADRPLGNDLFEEANGLVRVLSGADFTDVLFSAYGQEKDEKLGRAATPAGDLDGDQRDDLAVGAPGVTIGFFGNAGVVRCYSTGDGSLLRTLEEPQPQLGARFGSAVAGLASVDGDTVPDIVAGAPFGDIDDVSDVGRVHLFSGRTGAVRWTLSGTIAGSRVGHTIAASGDWNDDGIADVAVGNPGDAYRARRGAGSVLVLSGKDGNQLARFGGRLGIETRILALGRNLEGQVKLRNVKSTGRTTKLRRTVLRGVREGELSLAILDDDVLAAPADFKIAVSSGVGGSSQRIEVVRAGRRGSTGTINAEFVAPYAGGVNVGAGDLMATEGFEIVAVQADTDNGVVDLSIYSRLDTSPTGQITWIRSANFPVFQTDDVINTFDVNADGASVAIGAISELGNRIVVGPNRGTPVVRTFDELGTVDAEWLAFPPTQGNSGTAIAIGDLDGSGLAEVVTVPRIGQLRIRAFSGDGSPFLSPDTNLPVDFVPTNNVGTPAEYRVSVADIDLDGRGEILVTATSNGSTEMLVLEMDGTTPEGHEKRIRPFGPLPISWVGATTDNFVRHR